MKNILKALITSFTLICVTNTFLFAGIEKINDGLYVGKKGDIYFALERVTPETVEFWNKYADHQYTLAEKLEVTTKKEYGIEEEKYKIAQETYDKEYNDRKKKYNPLGQKELQTISWKQLEQIEQLEKTLDEEYEKVEPYIVWQDNTTLRQAEKKKNQAISMLKSISPFKHILTYYDNNEIWVAYATPKKITTESVNSGLKNENDIKMAFTISTHKDIPFSSHMGIFRAVDDINFNDKNVSAMNLHSFAAQAIQMAYNDEKEYMITKPLRIMREIMIKNLPKDAALINNYEDPIVSWSYPNMIIINKSGEKITFKKPDFFTKLFMGTIEYPMVIIDINALADFMTLD